ncbi:MAG TPA: DUF885 domain-containing protein [Xanthomonadaceae bacterium]|jgi:uncharacterized protein (DUF885 family)
MSRNLIVAIALALAAGFPAHAQSPGAAAQSLHGLFDAEWERGLAESPESASSNGDLRFNDRWSDQSLDAIHHREAEERAALDRLHGIDRKALSPADQLDYDTFEWELQHSVARQKFREYLQPVSSGGGVQTADGLAEVLPFATVQNYRDWLKRMDAVPTLVDQSIALMQEGVREHNTPPKVLLERARGQIAAQVVDDPAKSPFYRPFLKFPDAIPAADRAQLQAEAQRIVRGRVVPAYRKLSTYFNDDYFPKARDSIAAADLPDGRAYYDFLASYYTTTDLTAEQIHAIGLREVARIHAEMEKVKDQTGFKGTMPEFFTYLRSDPRFFEKTPEALFERYAATAKRIDPTLVKAFRTLPRLPYGVRPIPANAAPDSTTAYYQPGAADGSRPGYYYVNLYKPEVRPTWEMMPLTLHEAVPGHHLQFARELELPGEPMFRKTAYFVAYSEGWALYSEQLGYDLGLYDDPYDRFGQLTYEMWRAVRLVVDTGMHSMGWSRAQAIAYFKDNAAKTDQDIVNEIDRYISDPGQALAYKIGQMKISELREKARRELGPGFDLRDFDDAVLETGSVPLAVLEKHIDAWIDARRQAPASR